MIKGEQLTYFEVNWTKEHPLKSDKIKSKKEINISKRCPQRITFVLDVTFLKSTFFFEHFFEIYVEVLTISIIFLVFYYIKTEKSYVQKFLLN